MSFRAPREESVFARYCALTVEEYYCNQTDKQAQSFGVRQSLMKQQHGKSCADGNNSHAVDRIQPRGLPAVERKRLHKRIDGDVIYHAKKQASENGNQTEFLQDQ